MGSEGSIQIEAASGELERGQPAAAAAAVGADDDKIAHTLGTKRAI